MKNQKKELLLTAFVCLLPILAGAVLYPKLPEMMTTHWDMSGEANGWMPRAAAVFGLPLLILLIHLICFYAYTHDLRRGNTSAVLYTLMLWICPSLSLLAGTVTLGTGLGHEMHVSTLVPAFVGVIFLVIGNYLPKIKQNATMGIRLPWTLSSEENWNHTHRVAGFAWVAAGLLMVVSAFWQLHGPTMTVVLLAVAVGVPVVYSYLYNRREKGEKHGND